MSPQGRSARSAARANVRNLERSQLPVLALAGRASWRGGAGRRSSDPTSCLGQSIGPAMMQRAANAGVRVMHDRVRGPASGGGEGPHHERRGGAEKGRVWKIQLPPQ